MKPAQRMMALFSGNDTHHGTHGIPRLDPEGIKWTIRSTAKTLRTPPTLALWEDHLAGGKPLGVVAITTNNDCTWGSIDVDEYDIDATKVIEKIDAAKLPLVPCRSKSGGLHLFMFTTEPVEAAVMQSTLREIAASMGFGESEIFPKQTKLFTERGDQGSWMVMPYYGGDFGGKLKMQYGLKKTGAEMTIDEFIKACEKSRVTPEQMLELGKKRRTSSKKEKAPFSDGPPCLMHLASLPNGIPQGGQNNSLFQMGVYYKRAFPQDWQTRVEQANQKFMVPPLPAADVDGVIKSLNKKDYQYRCKEQPMLSHCDAMQCRMKKYGVGSGGTYPIITGLSKMNTEPAIWFVDVEETRLEVSTDDLQNYMKFHRICMEYTHKCFAMIRQDVWLGLVAEAMANLEVIEAAPDIGVAGEFLELLETFLTNKQRGQKEEDLLSGRPWENETEGRYYFSLSKLKRFLEREGLKEMKRGQVSLRLKKLGGESSPKSIKGKFINLWSLPSSAVSRTPSVDVPKSKDSPI